MHKILKKSVILVLMIGMFVTALFWATPGAAADPDGFEPNDSIDAAKPITPGYYAGLTIDPAGDVDYYNITLNAGDDVAVTICNMTTMFDLYLYDILGISKNASTMGWGNSEKVWWFDVPASGDYTIRVTGSGSDSGPYDMRVEAPFIDDACESNDDFASAWELNLPSTTGNLAFYADDYYKVWLTAGQYLNATVLTGPETGWGGIPFALYNSSYGVTGDAMSNLGYPASVLTQAGLDGWYYVVVNSTFPFMWGNYTLILQDVGDDAFEENDVAANAMPIGFENAGQVNAILMDEDWYQVQVNAGESIWACAESTLDNATFQITTSSGVVLADPVPNWLYGYPFANFSATEGGIYKIHVRPTGTPHTVYYSLDIARINVTHPADISYQAGETGHTITWHVEDSYWNTNTLLPQMMTAKVYMNGVPLADNYTWNQTKPVSVNVDGLTAGTYTFTIIAKNPYYVTVEDTVTVTVQASRADNDGIPGYPVAILAGFAVVALLALVTRRRLITFQK